jgi:hypothetical protein
MNADRAFRITAWVSLPSRFDSLKFRRAMMAMSVDAAAPARLEREAGLTRDDLRLLLAALEEAGVLEVSSGEQRRAAGPRVSESAEALTTPGPHADAGATEHASPRESTLRWLHSFATRHTHVGGRLSGETIDRPTGK